MIQEIIHFINRHPILIFTWVSLFITVIILTLRGLFTKIENITCTQAIQLLNKEAALTIDLRPNDEFRKGHIINSINLTSSKIKDNNIRELEKYKHKIIIVVSSNGIEAYKSAEQLMQYGFEHVFILKQGITGWSSDHLPLVKSIK